ncbi:MAG: peptidoglycan DD-metalloendopeptidase family protein [Treponema sp.]|nr:peptidoglycan DD-metalloendopeptidase family protein [Treponema sp.]
MSENKKLTPVFIIYVDGRRLNIDLEGAVCHITVNDLLNGISAFTIIFNAPAATVKELIAYKSEVSIHLGYKDDVEEVFSGEVLSFRGIFQEAGAELLEVSGSNVLNRLSHGTHYRSYENKKPSEVIRGLLEAHSLQGEVEDFGSMNPYQLKEVQSDYQCLLKLARKYGKEVYASGRTVYVRNEITARKDELIYELGKTLKSFDAGMNIKGLITRVEYHGWDYLRGENYSGKVELQDLPVKVGGNREWEPKSLGQKSPVETLIDHNSPDSEDARQQAIGLLQENSYQLYQAQGSVEGNYKIRPGMRTVMKMVGESFEGEYIIKSVEHQFDSGSGYRTSFRLKRNMMPGERKKKNTSERNEKKAEEDNKKESPKEEPEYKPLLKEILEVKCLDTNNNETAIYPMGEPITLEAACNASVEEGATVTFNIYREGADPKRDEPVETLTAINRAGRAVAEWAYQRRRDVKELMEMGRRFFFRVDSAGCEEVQSAVVEIEVEENEPMLDNWPVATGQISSQWGNRPPPAEGTGGFHGGIDIAVPVGTPVVATSNGTVVQVTHHIHTSPTRTISYGNMIVIRMDNGLTTAYMHLDRVDVAVNQNVIAGQQIGLSGNTGTSTGPHLHLSVWGPEANIPDFTDGNLMVTDQTINPITVLPPR